MPVSNQTWCWYCKQGIPSEAVTCPSCGKPLPDSKKVVKCPRCGKYLLKSADRCSQCGSPMHAPAGWPAPGAVPPMPGAVPPAQDPGVAPESAPAEQAASFPMESGLSPEERQAALAALEQLEAMGAQESSEHQAAAKKSSRRGGGRILVLLLALALAGAGLYFGVIRPRAASKAAEPPSPYCADDAHQWVEADCTNPKTCSICGLTEGEPLGHNFVDNVCTTCGAFRKPFYFSDSDCERHKDGVVFWGNIKNCSGTDAQYIQIKLDLYDQDMNPVASEISYAVTDNTLPMLEATRWEMRYNDTGLTWKYWRISAINYTPAGAPAAP